MLLLPGDIFARRNVAPVLQQTESEHSQDISVNDCFSQSVATGIASTGPTRSCCRCPRRCVLTSPAETGSVTLAMPQDVQAEAWDYQPPCLRSAAGACRATGRTSAALRRAMDWIRAAKRPMIIAGGGVLYSEAAEALRTFVEATSIPVGETMAGKGSMRYDHPLALGAVGATGTSAANLIAQEADLVIGIGTRYGDFTTASKTQFQDPNVRFININVAEFDAYKHAALPLVGDAATLEELAALLGSYRVSDTYRNNAMHLHDAWESEVDRIYAIRNQPLMSQGEIIGAVNDLGDPEAIMV